MENTNESDKNLEQSLVSNDDNGQESSPVEQDVKQTGLTAEEQAAVAGNEESSTETGEAEGGQEQEQPQGEEGQEAEQEQETAPEPPVVDKTGDEKLPFSRHERWKELVGEKNTYKQEIETLKPHAEQTRALNDFMAQNQIAPAEFQAALKYLQALRQNPQEAYAMLKPTFKQLAALVGEELSPELQAEVASGTLSVERAQQITRAEAQQRYQQWRQQQQQQGQQSSVGTLVQQTIGMAAQQRMQTDPDFKNGMPLWTLVDKNLRAMPQFQSPQDAQAGFERAYQDAKTFLSGLQPRTRPVASRRPPQTQSTGQNSRMVIKSSDDVIKLMQANGGRAPANIRYS